MSTDADLLHCSRHAETRASQRAISMSLIEVVVNYGCEQRSRGATKYFIPKKDWKYVLAELPPLSSSRDRLSVNVIQADDGTVVTVAHCYRRRRKGIQRRWTRRSSHRTTRTG